MKTDDLLGMKLGKSRGPMPSIIMELIDLIDVDGLSNDFTDETLGLRITELVSFLTLLRDADDSCQRMADDLEKLDPRSLDILKEAESRDEQLRERLKEITDELDGVTDCQ